MGNSFAKVYSSILDSSIWVEDTPTRITWITMLVMADANGFVEASASGIAHRARVTIEEGRAALDAFMRPDPDSKDQSHDGRRVLRVDGGFLIINYQKYCERRTPTQEQAAERKRRWRERLLSAESHSERERVTGDVGNATERSRNAMERSGTLERSGTADIDIEVDTDVLQDYRSNPEVPALVLSPEITESKSEKFADWLMSEWNRLAPPVGLPRWVIMSAPRRKRATALGKQFPNRENWTKVITVITTNRFCLGGNQRHWKADPEFLMREDTYARALEGTIGRWGASGSTNGTPVDVRQQVETGNAPGVSRRLQSILDEENT